jgi:hypothetical protein
MHVIRFRCPEPRRRCRRATPVAVYTTGPDRTAAIAAAACRHITMADLAAGRVPERLTTRGER